MLSHCTTCPIGCAWLAWQLAHRTCQLLQAVQQDIAVESSEPLPVQPEASRAYSLEVQLEQGW